MICLGGILKNKQIEVARFISMLPDASGADEGRGKENAPKGIYS